MMWHLTAGLTQRLVAQQARLATTALRGLHISPSNWNLQQGGDQQQQEQQGLKQQPQQPQRQQEHKFPLKADTTLAVLCISPHTAVDITNGPHDAVVVQSSSPQFLVSTKNKPTDNTICLEQLHQQGGQTPTNPAATTTAQIPTMFTSCHITTAGGSVALPSLQDASIHVSTSGGDVRLRSAKCNNVHIDSAGGSVTAKELGGSYASINSGRGDVTLGRLYGRDLEVVSSGGAVAIDALYAENADVASGGGALTVSHMACSGRTRLDSGGGVLEVHGLEGSASLLSGGGPIKVHLHERLQTVYVDSSGGPVHAWISPAAQTHLSIQAGSIQLDPALQLLAAPDSSWQTRGVKQGAGGVDSALGGLKYEGQLGAVGGGSGDVRSGYHAAATGAGMGGRYVGGAAAEAAAAAAAGASQRALEMAAAGAGAEAAGGLAAGAAWAPAAGATAVAGQLDSSRLARGELPAGSQLVINAGAGTVVLRAKGWMDGLRERVAAASADKKANRGPGRAGT